MEKNIFQHHEKKYFSTSWKKIRQKWKKSEFFFHGFFENSPDRPEMSLQDDYDLKDYFLYLSFTWDRL